MAALGISCRGRHRKLLGRQDAPERVSVSVLLRGQEEAVYKEIWGRLMLASEMGMATQFCSQCRKRYSNRLKCKAGPSRHEGAERQRTLEWHEPSFKHCSAAEDRRAKVRSVGKQKTGAESRKPRGEFCQ